MKKILGIFMIALAIFSTSCKKECVTDVVASFTVPNDYNDSITSTGGKTYLWNFGDGTTSTAQNPPAHVYTSGGEKKVTLTVTNGKVSATSFAYVYPYILE
jgi:PKD repeat protein